MGRHQLGKAPVSSDPSTGPPAADRRSAPHCTIGAVSAPAGPPPRIEIPRWIQLVGLPVAVFFAWVFGQAVGHTVFLFLVAALIALLLDPIVLALGAFKVRRGFSVAIVYLTFAAAIILLLVALGTIVVSQTKTAANRAR